MIEKKPESFSDIVDRAAAELRSMPVPSGPPPELLESLLQAAKEIDGGVRHAVSASEQPSSDGFYSQPLSRLQKIRNIIMKNPFKTFASVAACCLAMIAVFLTIGPMTRGSVAFAEVSAIIQKAKTMVCTGEMDIPLPGMTGNTKIKIMSLENGRMRQEMGKQIMIFDMPAGKTLTLNPEAKFATLLTVKGMPKQDMQQDYLASLKQITRNPKAEDLGLKSMDGKEVKGFRVKLENFTVTIWADSKSGEPITTEYLYHMPEMLGFVKKETTNLLDEEMQKRPDSPSKKEAQKQFPDSFDKEIEKKIPKGGSTMKMVLSNFQFDVSLDESLFSLTPPEGYTFQEMNMDWSGGGEKDVIEVLRRSADMENGVFPDSLTDQSVMIKMTMKPTMKWSFMLGVQAAIKGAQAAIDRHNGKPQKAPEMPPEIQKEVAEAGNLVGRMTMFLRDNEGWKYAGKGLKQGDAQTPIFWYVPKDSKQGRVIYGDLSARDVPADQLPPDPESKKSETK